MWQGAQVYREEKGRGLVSVGMIGWSSSSLSGMRWTGVVLFPSHFCGCCCRAVASEQITNKKTNRRGDRWRGDEATVEGLAFPLFFFITLLPRKCRENGWA